MTNGPDDEEIAAWDWMEREFLNIEAGHDPADRDYSPDEMVDAFVAGRASVRAVATNAKPSEDPLTTDELAEIDVAWERHKAASPHFDTQAMAEAFCAWRLPASVCADLCATDATYASPRSGTNLLTVPEAKQMFDHLASRGVLGLRRVVDQPSDVNAGTLVVEITVDRHGHTTCRLDVPPGLSFEHAKQRLVHAKSALESEFVEQHRCPAANQEGGR